MRIVIDMQGAQTESRFRGIGRYTLSIARAMARHRGEHEVFLALSGQFSETIEPIRAAFDNLLPQENIRVWHAPGPVLERSHGNDARREVAELLREEFLASLAPDVIHINSLFEGFADNAVTSIGRFDRATPISVSLHDLIPLLNPEHYLDPNPRFAQYYQRKIVYLKRASIFLAVSEYSRQEGIAHLDVPEDRIVNTSEGFDPCFQPLLIDGDIAEKLRQEFSLSRPFILNAGGADSRKNLPRLIQAFAALPATVRADYQLLLAGKITESNTAELKYVAKSAGLMPDALCFTGYVTDEKLIQLYNLCELFVFPSWHEGFGLPALEAMACGVPVIGANSSSLPEVIGLKEALFDPLDVNAMTSKMKQALEDQSFRATLRTHGLQQAQRFSWDDSAKRAIAAWESLHSNSDSRNRYGARSLRGSRLIQEVANYHHDSSSSELLTLAACLAQNQSAGVERQLLIDISELCQRDAATGVQRVVRSYLKWLLQSPPLGFRVEPVFATQHEGYRYARRFTQRFQGQDDEHLTDDPMRWQRGDIFFGLDMQHHVQLAHQPFYRQLRLEGVTVKFLVYDLLPIQLADLFKDSNARELHEQWLAMVAATDGAICISLATADALDAWIAQNAVPQAPNFQTTWVHIGGDFDSSNPSQGLPPEAPGILASIRSRPSLLCVSTLEPRKGQQQILEAVQLLWGAGQDINLVLVGQQGWKIEALADAIRNHPEQGLRLFWLPGISDEYLEAVYRASTCLVAASINEGFGLPLIEAARHGIPIIARDIPVFQEVAGNHAYYFVGMSAQALAEAIQRWLALYKTKNHPSTTNIPWSTWQQSAENLKVALIGQHYPRRQLLVDISELIQRDAKTGIQRVVRNVLTEWLLKPPSGWLVELVYASVDTPYRYAKLFTAGFLNLSTEGLEDYAITYSPGDVFLGLDLAPAVVPAHENFYQHLRQQGVGVKFVVYDLLPLMPSYFEQAHADAFSRWLRVAVASDGAICISRSVADDLGRWLITDPTLEHRAFGIDWFHLGAEIGATMSTKGFPTDAVYVLDKLHDLPSFLMVSTLSPHKGHAQVLDAFERLWHSGVDTNLVIVGKQGGQVDDLVARIRAHSELKRRLFWLEGISDEYLQKVYAASTCLIAASYGEGFGLPLIEAAQHKLPIIARDIPVFREVAGAHAWYFNARNGTDLANAVKDWLACHKEKRVPLSEKLPFLTWEQSAMQLMQLCISAKA